jgi:hypothetical protein
MEFLAGVAQIVICFVPIAALGAWVSSRGTTGLRGLVGPWRADPWPIGVQEEDPDAPWGHDGKPPMGPGTQAATAARIEELPTGARDIGRPEVARLHGSVRRPY